MKKAIEFIKKIKIHTYIEWKLYVSCQYNDVIYYTLDGVPCPPLPSYVPPNIKNLVLNHSKLSYKKLQKSKTTTSTTTKKRRRKRVTIYNIFLPDPNIDLNDYLSYDEAKETLKPFNITCYHDWLQMVMNARNPNNTSPYVKPANIPDNPNIAYLIDDSWHYWGHFLNIRERNVKLKTYHIHKDKYLSYEDAKLFAHTLKLSGYWDWKLYTDCPKAKDYYNKGGEVCAKKPVEIPVKVKTHYMKTGEWVSWQDFLGYEEKIKPPLYILQQVAKDNNIKTQTQWMSFAKENNYPKCLSSIYWAEWEGWNKFFNNNRRSFLPYPDAKNFLNTKSFTSMKSYREWWDIEKPEFLPRDLTYYRQYCKNHDIPFNSQDFLSSGIVEKFNNMVDISVVYISNYTGDYINNLISVSVDKKGLVNASLVMKKKNQTMLGMFNLNENTSLLRSIINRHCVRYHQGESNQYLVTNYNDFMNEMTESFEPVQIPSIIV